MELPHKCVSSKCEVHAVICFLTTENLSASAKHKWLQNGYGVKVMLECTVHLWAHRSMTSGETFTMMKEVVDLVTSDASIDEMRCAVPKFPKVQSHECRKATPHFH